MAKKAKQKKTQGSRAHEWRVWVVVIEGGWGVVIEGKFWPFVAHVDDSAPAGVHVTRAFYVKYRDAQAARKSLSSLGYPTRIERDTLRISPLEVS